MRSKFIAVQLKFEKNKTNSLGKLRVESEELPTSAVLVSVARQRSINVQVRD